MTQCNFGSSEKNTHKHRYKGSYGVSSIGSNEKRANPVAVDTRLSAGKGPVTRWVNDVVTSVPAAGRMCRSSSQASCEGLAVRA